MTLISKISRRFIDLAYDADIDKRLCQVIGTSEHIGRLLKEIQISCGHSDEDMEILKGFRTVIADGVVIRLVVENNKLLKHMILYLSNHKEFDGSISNDTEIYIENISDERVLIVTEINKNLKWKQ